MMLTARQEQILRVVVEAFTRSGTPVGSRQVAERADVSWAPSTVRSEFAVLVSHGLLEQPHTSAGRRPTESGYRYFVDGLLRERQDPAEPPIELTYENREIAAAIRRTTEALADSTELMALVSAPPLEAEEILRVELVQLAAPKVMVVVITSNGNVTKRTFEFDRGVDPGLVRWATGYLNERLGGVALGARTTRKRLLAPELTAGEHNFIEALSVAFLDSPQGDELLFVGGAGHLVGERAGDSIPGIDRLMGAVEQRAAVTRLLRARLGERGVYLRIGHENEASELTGASVVGANYGTHTRQLGSVNVIGPVRMDYPRAIASVRFAAARLSDFIADVYE
jgi:heat-inducible transcriptional repressor